MSKRFVCSVLFVLVMGLVLSSAVEAADPDLVGYWPFDGSAADASGNDNHGVVGGDPEWVPGKFNEALQFDGVDDYVTLTNQPPITNGFTFSAWVKRNGEDGAAQNIFNNHQFFLRTVREGVDPGNRFEAFINIGGPEPRANSNVASTIGQWFFLTVTWDKTTLEIYVDGELGGSSSRSGELDPAVEARIGRGEQGNLNANPFNGVIDEVRFYNRVLTEEEIQQIMTTGATYQGALNPEPANEATDVPRDMVLSWQPGEFADQHDVYFGSVLDDVNNATTTVDPAGVYKGRQGLSSYAVGETLAFGQTYYWRIDEVNAAPDYSVFKGDVWQFTAEPVGYPIDNIAVTASSENGANEGPGNTINGSGLDDDDLHSSESTAMWLTNMMDPNTAWIQFEFDRSYKLYQMLVWNYNSTVEPAVGFGIREATIEYSVDGANFSVLGTTHEFAQGPGLPGYASNTAVDLSGVTARYVRITANSNWSPYGLNQFGLSEVRFLYIPVWPREPNPDSGATDVGVDTILSFRAGREAARHDVYLDTDEQAVIDGLATATSVTEPGYAPSLDLAGTYYWRIDEVNDAESPTTWQGNIWNLSTQEYLVVDDFESYNDILSGQEGSRLVYEIWSDGFSDPSKGGSQIGYFTGTSLETDTVFDGSQSVPLLYDNTMAASSEVTANVADLQAGQDWAKHGIKALTLRFFGDLNNSVNEQMYVKIDGTKIPYDGDAEDLTRIGWQMWYIDLASTGVNLGNVTTLSVGFERIGALGGKGVVLLDGIRLYSHDRQLITPVEPGAVGLQAHYEFEGNTNDSSGNARHGAGMGTTFVAGKIGQAVNFDGLDHIEITGYKGILGSSAVTVTAWIKTISTDTGAIAGWGPNVAGERFGFRVDAGRLRIEHAGGNVQGDTSVNDGAWHHVAVTVQENVTISYPDVILYLNGADDTRPTTDTDPVFNLTAAEDVSIGRRPSVDDRYFIGQIDDVHIYDRALTQEEVTWLAGRIEPFDKPF